MKYVISLVSMLLSMGSAFAYQPPVGIPNPSWGNFHPVDAVAPGWPSGWPVREVVNHYYIDNTHPNSTDSNNPYGYPDRPRKEIPEITYDAGAYVEIHGSGYSGGGQIIFTANGTSTAPVWIRGASLDNKPVIRGEFIPKGGYIFIENLAFDTNGKTLSLRSHTGSTVNHVSVRNNDLVGPGTNAGFTSAILVSGASATSRSSDVVIYNNTIHHFGDSSATSAENDFHGVGVGGNVDRVWILNNRINNMGGDSVQIGSASMPDEERPSYVYVGGNVFHDDRENAVDIKESNHVVISQNLMYGYEQTSSSSGEVVVIHNDPTYIWIIDNVIHGGVRGVVTTGSTNTWVIGNVIRNIHRGTSSQFNPLDGYQEGAAVHFRGNSTGGVISNTLYGYDIGIQLTQGSNYDISNNIFAGRSEASGVDVYVGGSAIASSTKFDFNLFSVSAPSRIAWSGTAISLASAKTSTGKCSNCLDGEPGFKNAGANDFVLTNLSHAINKGTNHRVYDDYLSLYKVDLSKDQLSSDRVIGGRMDIGAYEYQLPFAPPAALPLQVQ